MKKITALLLTVLLLCTTACNGSTPAPSPSTAPSPSAGASADEQTYTGLLEQIGDGMIIVTPEDDDSIVYTFDTEGITVSAQLGGKVRVTYTGDLSDADSLLKASNVEAVK